MTPFHFLLVEDNDAHAEITLTSLLDDSTHTVDRVIDGEQALAYVRKQGVYADRPRPDVILLDLKLPKIDGQEVLEKLKHDPELKIIPIVILTTSESEADRLDAYGNYVNSYLVKPIRYDKYQELIAELSTYWSRLNLGAENE